MNSISAEKENQPTSRYARLDVSSSGTTDAKNKTVAFEITESATASFEEKPSTNRTVSKNQQTISAGITNSKFLEALASTYSAQTAKIVAMAHLSSRSQNSVTVGNKVNRRPSSSRSSAKLVRNR